VFIIHAKSCKQAPCQYQWCPLFKTLIAHILKCSQGSNCETKHCYSTKELMRHFRSCGDKKNCPTCSLTLQNIAHPPRAATKPEPAQPPAALEETAIVQQVRLGVASVHSSRVS
jgi:hypothetical protein